MYGAATWFHRIIKVHGLRLISSIPMLVISFTRLQKNFGGCPLCFKATTGRVLRLGIPTGNQESIFYQPKMKSDQVEPIEKYFFQIDPENNSHVEINIYTDGSKMEDETAYAFCVYQRGELIYEDQIMLNKENIAFQTELLAIEEALLWIGNSPYKEVLIHSDSL